jgi:putative transposase
MKDGYIKGKHSVYKLTYHLVFVTNYRKKYLTEEIIEELKEFTNGCMEIMNGSLIEMNGEPDHIHLLIQMMPSGCLSKVVRVLKCQYSILLKKNHSEWLKEFYYGNPPLWSPSYFASTTGSVSIETVKSYIDSQATDAHKRKYERKAEGTTSKRKKRRKKK